MRKYLIPTTKAGIWSVGLIFVMFALFVIGRWFSLHVYGSVSAGETILGDIVLRPGTALSMLAGFASGIAAFITGLVAIIKKKEKAVPVFLATIIGTLLTLFLAGEVMFPH